MSLRTPFVFLVVALSSAVFACDATPRAVKPGALSLSVRDVSGNMPPLLGEVTLNGLDNGLHTHVSLASADVSLSLPAGLYNIEWTPAASFEAEHALGSEVLGNRRALPGVIVIAPERVTRLSLRTDPSGAADARLLAAVESP